MGGIIAVGARFSVSDQRCALMYTSDLQYLTMDYDLACGQVGELSDMIDKMSKDNEFGPCPVCPYGYGLRFYDFVSGTIFDSQSHLKTNGIEWWDIFESKRKRDGRFERMVPLVKGMTRYVKSGNELEVKKMEIEPVKTVPELWAALGFNGFPGRNDFQTLDLAYSFWNLEIFQNEPSSQEIMKIEMEDRQILSMGDLLAWSRHLSKVGKAYEIATGWVT